MEEMKMETETENGIVPRTSFKSRLVWIGIFGFLLGMVLKTEAVKRFTIGFDDYKLGASETRYDINLIQKELQAEEEAAKQKQMEASNPAVQPQDGSCDSESGTCSAE